jgi:lysophospholipase L1-like esterase
MKIHVIGDSHAQVFDGEPGFVAVHIPMATAHNLISDTSTSNSKRILLEYLSVVTPGDYILLCFGEIDCRFHIFRKSRLLKKPVSKLVDVTIGRYMEAVEMVSRHTSRQNVGIINIVPAGNWDRVPMDRVLYGFPPSTTPHREARVVNEVFRNHLANECHARGYNLIDIWDSIFDPSTGYTKEEYVGEDPVHLNKNAVPLFINEIRKVFPGIEI